MEGFVDAVISVANGGPYVATSTEVFGFTAITVLHQASGTGEFGKGGVHGGLKGVPLIAIKLNTENITKTNNIFLIEYAIVVG